MTRTYERQTKHWDIESLHAAAEAGQAQKLEAHGIWIVTLDEGGKVAVRPEQILYDGLTDAQHAEQARAERDAENAWLRHAEAGNEAEIELERQMDAQRGVVSFEDAWDAADPVHAAERKLRHAGRAAYEQALHEAKGWADDIPEGRIEAIQEEILAGDGSSTAAEEAKVAQAALLAKFGVT